MMTPSLVVRELRGLPEYEACVALQKATWGDKFAECVPPTLLRVAQETGGVAAGAFVDETLVGFVFGVTGLRAGQLIHWSDMLAVASSHRNLGIGGLLKRYQRQTLLARGIERVLWSFDPLDARNAHINFNRLGVYAGEYIVDMYGDTASPLHAGIGTDRLIVTWDLSSERVGSCLAGNGMDTAAAEARIEIPADIHGLKQREPQQAREWRARTRQQFLACFPDYVVSGFVQNGESPYYKLMSTDSFAT